LTEHSHDDEENLFRMLCHDLLLRSNMKRKKKVKDGTVFQNDGSIALLSAGLLTATTLKELLANIVNNSKNT